MKKNSAKKIIKHLKGDIKTFNSEAAEDKELIRSLKKKDKKSGKKESKKRSEKKEPREKRERKEKKD